jgi:putative membrane-bound dehydrogenase-like protein
MPRTPYPADRRIRLLCLGMGLLFLVPLDLEGAPQEKPRNQNLARGKSVQASSEETGKSNFAGHAVDGKMDTRWCASGGRVGEWLQIDLGKMVRVGGIRIYWEMEDAAYRYQLEASPDGRAWTTIVQRVKNVAIGQVTTDRLDLAATRYLKVTFLGSSTGAWGSIRELEVYSKKPPEIEQAPSVRLLPSKVAQVNAPKGWDVTLFAHPPTVNYPVCLTAAPTGELFIGIDQQGSLGKKPGGGKVVRCVDTNHDGIADRINVFCTVEHPRGLIWDRGKLWVLHPPHLTLYADSDGDGQADRQQRLVSNLSTSQNQRRGADHTTNGIRMGIDGWIYIAVGDFGMAGAKGTDGRTLTLLGGGVVRVRPDGTELELYARGLRNILDVCIDPYMNLFTRDNTNDGGGWNIRFSHIIQSGRYGYPRLFKNYTDEILPALRDYGGGSGCGGLYVHEPGLFPRPVADAVLTCDWGRSMVYLHRPRPAGPTFSDAQQVFLQIPRPTDIDVDGSGRLYVSSWANGQFNYSGPNVGFVARLTPKGWKYTPFPDLLSASDVELVQHLRSKSAVRRLAVQRVLLERVPSQVRAKTRALVLDRDTPLYARVAALYTVKQLDGKQATPFLVDLARDPTIREHALRALADRKTQMDGVPLELFVTALEDDNPRVRLNAAIALGRLGKAEAAPALLKAAAIKTDVAEKMKSPEAHATPCPEVVIPHVAVQSLVSLHAVDACLHALDGPYRAGALWALKYLHDERAVAGILSRLQSTSNPLRRQQLLNVAVRLYYRESAFDGSSWWGTRPDTRGPYYKRETWSGSAPIAATITRLASSLDPVTRQYLARELVRQRVQLPGLDVASLGVVKGTDVGDKPIPDIAVTIPMFDPKNPRQIGNQTFERILAQVRDKKGDVSLGKRLFQQQSCVACHAIDTRSAPIGPQLHDIGKRYNRHQLLESLLRPSAQLAQGFSTNVIFTKQGQLYTGFVVREGADTVILRTAQGRSHEIRKTDIEERALSKTSAMPEGMVNNLTVEELAALLAYLETLESK